MRSIGVPVLMLLSAAPAAAEADTRLKPSFLSESASGVNSTSSPRMIVPAADFTPQPNSPFFASLAIAPNAAVGIGKFVTPPRRRVSLQDQPVSLHAKKVKRAAVGLSLHF